MQTLWSPLLTSFICEQRILSSLPHVVTRKNLPTRLHSQHWLKVIQNLHKLYIFEASKIMFVVHFIITTINLIITNFFTFKIFSFIPFILIIIIESLSFAFEIFRKFILLICGGSLGEAINNRELDLFLLFYPFFPRITIKELVTFSLLQWL